MNTELRKIIRKHLKESYSNGLPIQYIGRLEDELAVIQGSDFLDDLQLILFLKDVASQAGYEIDERIESGTSLIKSLWGASLVDPLPPYYYCHVCGKMEFVPFDLDGFDLPEKTCCGHKMVRSGHSIPFEHYRHSLIDHHTGLAFRTADSFVSDAVDLVKDHYEENGIYHAVQFDTGMPDNDSADLVLLPQTEPLPETDENGIWRVDPDVIYSDPSLRFIHIVPSEKKEQLAEYKEITGRVPGIEELLTEPVMKATRKELLRRIERVRLFEQMELSFTSLVALRSYMRSEYDENNPVINSQNARYTDLFTCREEVWDMISKKVKPEYGIGSGFANKITRAVRSGSYTNGRMPEGAKNLLRELGIEDHWIEQMQYTCYLPPKADVISSLLDDMKLVWYELQK
ncbi:MAG: hypothetical protein K5771_08845 [Oscillospiraceae bacterium]|nr:hypothetical protein [Oscillospiraceae bacterium]